MIGSRSRRFAQSPRACRHGLEKRKLTPQSGVHYVAEGLPFNWTKVNTEGRKTFSAFAELEAAKEKVAILACSR